MKKNSENLEKNKVENNSLNRVNESNKEAQTDSINQEPVVTTKDSDVKEKKKISVKIKESFTSRKFKSGAYSIMISIVVIALILIVNLIAGELNLKVDMSKDELYTLTKDSKKILKNIKDDVTIYYIAGEKNEISQVKEVIDKYETLSKNIKVVRKDPVLYPNFTSKYVSEDVTENSVIIVNNKTKTYKYVSYNDMLKTSYDSSYNPYVSGVDIEGQVTSAIQYVTSSDWPTIYTVHGHNEVELGDSVKGAIQKQNITTNTLNLLTEKTVPKDCSLLVINGPTNDLSKDEVEKVKTYLEGGGKAIIFAAYTTNDLTNFDSLLKYYGIKLAGGGIVEGDSNYYMSGSPAYLLPTIEEHDITKTITENKKPILLPASKGIIQLEAIRSSLKIEKLLSTSDKAFSKVNVNSSNYNKEDSDISGPFDLGVLITDTYNNTTSKIVVYGSTNLIDESLAGESQLGNADLFISTINYLTEKTNSLSIPVRSVEDTKVTLTTAQTNMWGIITVFVIPFGFLATGIVVTYRRRRK